MSEQAAPRLLWVLPKYPLPPTDGARHASTVLLKALTAFGVQIDLVILDDASEKRDVQEVCDALGVQQVLLVPRRGTAGSQVARGIAGLTRTLQVPRLPITFQPYRTPVIQQVFDALVEARVARLIELGVTGSFQQLAAGWDAMVYDGLHAGAHLFDGTRCVVPEEYPPIIYRAHNVESDIWLGKVRGEPSWWKKRLFLWQAGLVREFELAFLRKVSGACGVSAEDQNRLGELLPRLKRSFVPIGYEFPTEFPKRTPKAGHYLFVGKLDWPPNREGLEWFLKEVWPELLARGGEGKYSLSIVGQGDGSYLQQFSNLPGVTVKGFVESLEEEYHAAEASIVPLFYGSGTRVKIVEATRFGCPIISTDLGAMGLGLLTDVSFFEAESIGDWIVRLTNTSSERFTDVAKQAFRSLQMASEPRATAEQFVQFTREVVG